MRKYLTLGIGAAIGVAAAYLFDPDRGRSRRAKLADQAAAKAREAGRTAKSKADYQRGVAKGVIHEAAESLRPERSYDDDTLLQKVRSEALGYMPDTSSINVDITDGTVRISGSVSNDGDRKRLIDLISHVEGVAFIDDRLSVGT